jgi:hypothetical protein
MPVPSGGSPIVCKLRDTASYILLRQRNPELGFEWFAFLLGCFIGSGEYWKNRHDEK